MNTSEFIHRIRMIRNQTWKQSFEAALFCFKSVLKILEKVLEKNFRLRLFLVQLETRNWKPY